MHIRQLRIQNLACFDDVTLDFTNDEGKPCRWIVLLGENGTGKSTALRALITGLPPEVIGRMAPPGTEFRTWLKGSRKCDISIVAASDPGDIGHERGSLSWRSDVEDYPEGMRHGLATMGLNNVPYADRFPLDKGWFIVAYRPWRGGRRVVETGDALNSYAIPAPREERVESLFDNYDRLTLLREWLVDLDFRRLKETGRKQERADALYKLAISAIESIFPKKSIKIVGVTPTKDVILEEDGVQVSISSLSDGYQSAMSWIGDLVRRLVEAFPENPLHAHGVVLLDEIDLHLHPSWQRSIVDQIRSIFPNLQFIVTTHSPFIAQDMTEDDKIIVLKRDGNRVTVTEDKGFVQGWRVDQILTSYLFGLSDTRGQGVEDQEKTRRDLLDRRAQNGLSADEQETLARVNSFIANIKSSPEEKLGADEPTDADLRRAANDILQILAKRQLRPAGRK